MVSFTQGIIYQFTTQICNWRLNAAKNMTKNITNKYMGKLFIHSFYSILMILIVPKVPDCIINCFLHFVKQFASTLIVKVEIILLHNGLFPDHVDFHVARDSTRFFCYLCPSAFSFVWVQPFTTGVTELKLNPQIHCFLLFMILVPRDVLAWFR